MSETPEPESAGSMPAEQTGDVTGETPDTEVSQATGHPAVDAVLESLSRLEELPVGEHPPIFEEAHDALRSALAEARDGRPEGRPAPGSSAER